MYQQFLVNFLEFIFLTKIMESLAFTILCRFRIYQGSSAEIRSLLVRPKIHVKTHTLKHMRIESHAYGQSI